MADPLPPPATTFVRAGKDGLQRVGARGRWTAESEERFLRALEASCNIRASASAAGFSFQSAHRRRRTHPDFARRWEAALDEGLLRLESELLNAAQQRVEGRRYNGPITEVSFAAALQLLAFHTRRRRGKAWAPRPDARVPTSDELAARLREQIGRVRRSALWRDGGTGAGDWRLFPAGEAPKVLAMHMRHDPAAPAAPDIAFDQFLAVDIRVGRIVGAEAFPQARKPAFKLVIDFGPAIGTRRSSAQITEHYAVDELPGRLVAAVVNFPPRQIGPFVSEVLTLGFPDADGKVVLVSPDQDVPVGGRLF